MTNSPSLYSEPVNQMKIFGPDDNDSPVRTYNYFKILNTKFKPNNV